MNLIGFIIFMSVVQLCHATSRCTTRYFTYRKSCRGWWGWWGCSTKSTTHTRCCSTHYGSNCDIPKCRLDYERHWGRDPQLSCNRINEGYIVYKNGTVVTQSGGTCDSPGRCVNCNVGYYPTTLNNGYCKACPPISNCNIPTCTNSNNVICEYCVGEYIAENPGYNVYTGQPDRKSCQQTCSWRDGARCFPGSCGEDYIHEGCKCAAGFGGKNCAVATSDNKPTILEMAMVLRHEPNPALQVDALNSSHNAIFWTKETIWSSINVTLKATYKPTLNGTIPNYIIKNVIGVEYMNTELTLQRGEKTVTWEVDGNCETYAEHCSNYIQQTLVSVLVWKPVLDGGAFQHMDRITISMRAKNGGTVLFENREGFVPSGYKNESYTLHGSVATETRHLIFDIYPPTHCFVKSDICEYDALVVQDIIKQASVTASWGGWDDSVSGIASYTCHVYHLKMLNGSSSQGELSKSSMVTPETIVNEAKSSVLLSLEEPGPYAVELIVADNAGNIIKARRILLFDNASVVARSGGLPYAVQAGQTGWINMTISSIELQWTNRYRNIRHLNFGWLNAVAEDKDIIRDLDDIPRRSYRTTAPIHNINGIVRVEIARHNQVNGRYEFGEFEEIPLDYFNGQHMVYPTRVDDLVDGKKIIYSIRAIDVTDEYAEDNVTVMIDLSPPMIEQLWLSNGEFVNISVQNVKELEELTIEFVTYDQHSGIDEIYWRIFDNYTNTVVVHGKSGTPAQGETSTLDECKDHYRRFTSDRRYSS